MTGRILCLLAIGGWAASAAAAPSQDAGRAPRVAEVFANHIQAYVKMRTDLAKQLSTPKSTPDPQQIADHEHALADMLTAARRDARQGDVFTPGVAKDIRSDIRKAFRGSNGRNIRRTILEGDPVTLTALRVNDIYPEDIPVVTMPPTLLRRLPALPKELSYRIVGRELILEDVATHVIVDVLPDAIPPLR